MDLNTLSVPRKKELNLNKEYLNIDEANCLYVYVFKGI